MPAAAVAAAAVASFKAAAVLHALLRAEGPLGGALLGDLRGAYGEEVAYVLSKPRVLARLDRKGGPGLFFAGRALRLVREVVGRVKGEEWGDPEAGDAAGLPTF